MSEMPTECAICMDDINFKVNCVTTECGHCFHSSCLLKNVAHNGFGCPYCRNALAEPVEEDDSDGSEEETFVEEVYDDDALRGLRFFMDNIEGVEHEQEDILEQEQQEQEELEVEVEQIPKPTPAYIAQKLLEQGITMELMVKALLKDHEEYDVEEEAFLRIDDELFGKFRIIISNYQPPQPVNNLELVATA